MPPGPLSPASMPSSKEHQQQRRAEAHRDQARQDAGQHQQRAEQNADADDVEGGHEVELSGRGVRKVTWAARIVSMIVRGS